MARTPAATLARIKVAHPAWTITKVEPNGDGGGKVYYTAVRQSTNTAMRFATLADLEYEFNRLAGSTPGR